MKVSIFKYRKYVAKNARNIVLKNFFISLIRYIVFIPFILVIIVCLGFVFLLYFVLSQTNSDRPTFRESFKDFSLLREAINYFSKDSLELIFCNYHCHFKCKICKKKCYYSVDKIDSHTNLPLWGWLDNMPNTCRECYVEKVVSNNYLS